MLFKGLWDYSKVETPYPYGETTTYKLGLAFLDGYGDIEDWGCGLAFAKSLVKKSNYKGIDGSWSKFADATVDLETYTSSVDCIFIRHVLEHNHNWKKILENAVKSFKKRMVIILFTPLSEGPTHTINGNPDYSFYLPDITDHLKDFKYNIEKIESKTQYAIEHIIYVERVK
jgi:SAM-dependent methyltransferase